MRRIIVLVSVILISFFGCKGLSTQKDIANVPVSSAIELVDNTSKLQLIDVRTPEEYEAGHLERAANIDFFSDSFRAEIEKLDKHKPVLVYCKSGGRSSKSAAIFKELGFTKIYNMEGGITSWKEAGYKTVK
ncbi:rhodanese-like domain-containing protein [Aestuariibaculum sp. M13]|uniref:rhodanese-like domain-containing protein n=1 Tax=Aestuariibaculum sp. M13 TaxID=2967132 RepID=UPI002159C759|nr:rhodanese-like domain-containing protein [Aestuariibaculum sp. M13]MCR8666490.1 rhodanese-like domain-containing protein [Aestuariibaculum sp. M13]